MANRACIAVAFAAGILFVACAQLIGIESLPGWCGDGVIDREGGEGCDEGDSDDDGHPDDTETCNGDCSVPTASSCYARCCDGTLAKGAEQNDINQCIFWGGMGCSRNGGPVSIRHGGLIAWEKEQDRSCPTVRACSVRCCDDAMIMMSGAFEESICRLVQIDRCQSQGHGEPWQVSFDDIVVWEGSCG